MTNETNLKKCEDCKKWFALAIRGVNPITDNVSQNGARNCSAKGYAWGDNGCDKPEEFEPRIPNSKPV